MSKLYFYTPTKISYLDLVSIGGSDKEGDESTIGQFHTGLKNAIAMFMRNEVEITFNVYSSGSLTTFTPEVFTKECKETSKSKELIGFKKNNSEFIESTVSPRLGFDWEPWMAVREIYANMVDEGGYYDEIRRDVVDGTEIIIDFSKNIQFQEIWNNRGLFFNEQEPTFKLEDVDILDNPEGYLKIYKRDILVYSDKNRKSKYAYNIYFGDLDDRRTLRDMSQEMNRILRTIGTTDNLEFISSVISVTAFEDTLNDFSFYYTISPEFKEALETFSDENDGEVHTYSPILSSLRGREDCKLKGRKIRTLSDAIWSTSKEVVVEMTNKQVEEAPREKTIKERFLEKYNFNIECDIIQGDIHGSECVADKYNKVIILSENFDIEKDFYKFVIQYLDLTESGNIVDNLAKTIEKLVRKP